MATSGSTNFTANANDIISVALRNCGVLGEGEEMTDAQRTESILPLNMMVKTWQAAGLRLSAIKTAYLFPEIGKNDHQLSSSPIYNRANDFAGGSDLEIKDQYAYGPLQTYTLVADSVSSYVVYDTTVLTEGVQLGDLAGIYSVAEETLKWGTVSVHQISGADYRIQISDGNQLIEGLTGDVLYILDRKAPRPLKILEAYVSPQSNSTEIPIDIISRREYDALSTKNTAGTPNQIYYDPQRTVGIASIWPQTNDVRNYIKLRIKAPIEDFDAGTDDADLPQEWLLPLALNLALILAPTYGVPAEDFKKIQLLAASYYDMVFDFEQETETSMYIEPEI